MTKVSQFPASVVRAFLNDDAVWAAIYLEDEEYLVDGKTLIDLSGVADTAMVTIKGGDIYAHNGGARLAETLPDVFNRYMASGITVVVRTVESRQQELLDLLASHGFTGELVTSGDPA
jgi:hypothetical protein